MSEPLQQLRVVPPVGALLAFEAAVRLGSIRRAGSELALSHSVVSRHIRNLEALVGTKLVAAGPDGVIPTPEGARYHAVVAGALGRIAAATAELRPAPGHEEVRIACAAGLARRWLTRRLPALENWLAPVEIMLVASDRPPDFARRDADIAISFGAIPDPSLRAEVLTHPRMFPVASPAYLAAHGPVDTLEALAGQALLHEDSREQWRHWFALAGVTPPRLVGPRLRYADMTVEAAIQGQGVALANDLLAGPELADGRLVECGRSTVRLAPYVVQGAARRWDDAAVRRLRAWLRQEVAAAERAQANGAKKAPPG